MKKTLIAAATTLLLATGAASADSSLLDVQGAPERGTSQAFLPNFGLYGGGSSAISADNRFGDEVPAFAKTDAAPAVDFTPTAAIDGGVANEGIYSADNGFGDYSPGYFGQVR